jgi:hypothetical protein
MDDHGDDRAADDFDEALFDGTTAAKGTAGLIEDFLEEWRRAPEGDPQLMLQRAFARHADLFASPSEQQAVAEEIILAVNRSVQSVESLERHEAANGSRNAWWQRQLETGAAVAGANDVVAYANTIDSVLARDNADLIRAMTTRAGAINQNPQLHGFLAEHHHAASFNIDAVAKGSALRAEVIGSNALDSADVVIRDGSGKIVERYQSKYCASAEEAARALKAGNYRGQTALVANGQHSQVPAATNVIEREGVRSQALPYDQARDQQRDLQQQNRAPTRDWHDVRVADVAKRIGKESMLAAACAFGIQAAVFAGQRAVRSAQGKENPPLAEAMGGFLGGALPASARVGVTAAITGGVVVAARRGLLPALKTTPAGTVANLVFVGIEIARALGGVAKGKITPLEAVDSVGRGVSGVLGGLVAAGKGAVIGAAWGGALGPPGVAVGGFIGGVVGALAGSVVAEQVWRGAKSVAKAAQNVVGATFRTVGRGLRAVFA